MGSLTRWLFSKKSPDPLPQSEDSTQENKNNLNLIDETQSQTLIDENARLRQELQKLTLRLKEKTKKLQSEGESEGKSNDIYKLLEEDLINELNQTETVDLTTFSTKYTAPPISTTSSSISSSTEVEADSKKAVLVCLPSKDEDEEDQVCMVDLTEAEWWTIVDSARDREIDRSDAETYVDCELAAESTNDDDDSYLLVEEKQLGTALTDFVAQTILKKYPEAKTLNEKQLNSLIDSSFHGLKEPTTVGRYVRYGQMAYTTYGWGMCAWSLWKDPKMIKIAAKCALSAARWVIILVF